MATYQNKTQYDSAITNLCSNLGVNASNYTNYTNGSEPSLDRNIKELCACHLQPEVYQNFWQSITNELTFLSNSSFSPKCYFPACGAINLYKPGDMTGCPSINCLNFTSLTGTGVVNGLISITGANQCEQFDQRNTCVQDSDCSSTQKCYQSKCVDKNICRQNSDCGQGKKCYLNSCIDKDFCDERTSLSPGYKCLGNKIVEDTFCYDNSNCKTGETCISNLCQKYTISNLTFDYKWWIIGGVIGALGVFLLVAVIIYVKRRQK
jgi:hypothetical protein